MSTVMETRRLSLGAVQENSVNTTAQVLRILLFSVHVSNYQLYIRRASAKHCFALCMYTPSLVSLALYHIRLLDPPDEGSPCVSGEARLISNGTVNNISGIVEVCVGGRWSTVCSGFSGFNDAAAQVICRQLGHPNPES